MLPHVVIGTGPNEVLSKKDWLDSDYMRSYEWIPDAFIKNINKSNFYTL